MSLFLIYLLYSTVASYTGGKRCGSTSNEHEQNYHSNSTISAVNENKYTDS